MSILFAVVATIFTSFFPILNKQMVQHMRPVLIAWTINLASLPLLTIGAIFFLHAVTLRIDSVFVRHCLALLSSILGHRDSEPCPNAAESHWRLLEQVYLEARGILFASRRHIGAETLDVDEMDSLLRKDNIDAVLAVTDQAVLGNGLGIDAQDRAALHRIWRMMRESRRGRR